MSDTAPRTQRVPTMKKLKYFWVWLTDNLGEILFVTAISVVCILVIMLNIAAYDLHVAVQEYSESVNKSRTAR